MQDQLLTVRHIILAFWLILKKFQCAFCIHINYYLPLTCMFIYFFILHRWSWNLTVVSNCNCTGIIVTLSGYLLLKFDWKSVSHHRMLKLNVGSYRWIIYKNDIFIYFNSCMKPLKVEFRSAFLNVFGEIF